MYLFYYLVNETQSTLIFPVFGSEPFLCLLLPIPSALPLPFPERTHCASLACPQLGQSVSLYFNHFLSRQLQVLGFFENDSSQIQTPN